MNIYLAAWFIKYGDPDADFDRIPEAEWIAGRYIRDNGISEFERIKSEVRTVDGEPCLLLRAMPDGVLPTPLPHLARHPPLALILAQPTSDMVKASQLMREKNRR